MSHRINFIFLEVDNEQFRSSEDPENKEFLAQLAEGRIPTELQDGRKEIHVNLVDKRHETYKVDTNSTAYVFSRVGNTLGGNSGVVGGTATGSRSSFLVLKFLALNLYNHLLYIFSFTSNFSSDMIPAELPVVDASQPTGNIQIKLANGKKLTIKYA